MNENEDSSGAALFLISEAYHSRAPVPKVMLGDTPLRLATHGNTQGIVGSGQLKSVYVLPDGRAVALPKHYHNLSREGAQKIAENWERAIREEKELSDSLRKLGLETQQIEIQPLTVGDYTLPVMVMPSFGSLIEQGMQVRDRKPEGIDKIYGNSMYFGTPENVENPARLKAVMQGVAADIATLMSEGISLTRDAFNLVIKDTPATPPNPDRRNPVIFDALNQEIRLFFFDLANTLESQKNARLPLLDESGNLDRKRIEKRAAYYLEKAFEPLVDTITLRENEEITRLPGGEKYRGRVSVQTVIEENFERVKLELTKEIADKVSANIAAMPVEERLRKFSRPENSPPLDLPGNGRPEEIALQPDTKKKGLG